ncbi:MAG: hypothetical protein DRG25_06110 [Deltaproteobacteria bacterium]|nr:MAG: hypothetical protein DRG25_06110 [Deltaproteobacteria bacterium]
MLVLKSFPYLMIFVSIQKNKEVVKLLLKNNGLKLSYAPIFQLTSSGKMGKHKQINPLKSYQEGWS